MTTYVLEVKDLAGSTVVADALLQSPECTVGFALNSMGTISFRLPVTGTGVTDTNYLPGQRTLLLKADGTPVWGGYLLAAKADRNWVTFTGKSWEFALTQTLISDNRRYLGIDQFDIAWDLINDFVPAAHKGTRASATPSGKTRRYTICCDDLVSVYDAIRELASYFDGFDFWYTPGRAWTVAYQNRGTDVSGTVVFDDTVNLTNATYTYDAEYDVNRVWYVRPDIGSCGDLVYLDQGGSPAGWVRESGLDLSDVEDATDRSDRVKEVLRSGQVIRSVEGTVDAQTGIEFGDFDLGDRVACSLSRGFATVSTDLRVLEYTVTLKESCVSQMSVRLDNLLT